MRAEPFQGQALTSPSLRGCVCGTRPSLILGPMNEAELRVAIEKQADLPRRPQRSSAGLVERLLGGVGAGTRGTLPLLEELALTLLWDRQKLYSWMAHVRFRRNEARWRAHWPAMCPPRGLALDSVKDREGNCTPVIGVGLVHQGVGTEDTRRVAPQR